MRVSACGSWKASELPRSVLTTSCAALAADGVAPPSPAASSASSSILLHRSGPGAPAVRRCCVARVRVRKSHAGSPEDPAAIFVCLPSRRRALLFGGADAGLGDDPCDGGCRSRAPPAPDGRRRERVGELNGKRARPMQHTLIQ